MKKSAIYQPFRHVALAIPGVPGCQARRTGNMYEKQRMTDVFRVPFVVPAPKAETTGSVNFHGPKKS